MYKRYIGPKKVSVQGKLLICNVLENVHVLRVPYMLSLCVCVSTVSRNFCMNMNDIVFKIETQYDYIIYVEIIMDGFTGHPNHPHNRVL